MSTSTISRRRTDRPSLAQTFWLTLVVFFAFAGVHVPAAVAQVTITAGNGDVPITRVVLEANGNTVTQTSSQSGVSNGATSDPVMVREITINDNGNTVVLDEFNFVNVDVRHINFPPRCIQGATLCDSGTLTGVSVWDNGTVTDVQAPAFEADLEDALGDTDLMNFIRYDGINISGTNWEPDFDFVYTTPLTNDDYLLVMERNGNTFFDLIPLDINGDPIPGGQTVGFNKNYRWNTGFAPSENAGQPQWFTVADIEVFNVNTDNTPIYGFRIDNNGEADVKFFGLSPDVFVPPASIGDFVFDDLDGDGIQDPGEPGIENILVRLFDDNGQLITTTRTDANGNYLFPGLEPGTYVLHFVAPNGSIYSPRGVGNDGTVDSDVNPADGKTAGITVASGQDRTDIDAGIFTPAPGIKLNKNVYPGHNSGASCPGTDLTEGFVGDAITYCFIVENTGNTFLGDITLDDADINIDRTDLTLLSGTEPLAPGASLTFFFETALTGDLTNTASTSGNPTNANGNDLSGVPHVSDDDTAEVRAEQPASIGDFVFDDLDGDGIQDPGEPGIENILVRLFDDNNNLITTTRTDANGNYLFPGLEPGTYVLHFVAPNGSIYSPRGVGNDGTVDSDVNPADGKTTGITVAAGQDRTDIDAGIVTPAPGIDLNKNVYAGHDGGASCPGGDLTEGLVGDAITYCFVVENTGNTFLDAITVTDADISIDRSDLTLLSGTEPLAPGASLVFFFETALTGDLTNTASTSGNPTNANGTDIPGQQNLTDSDTAEVRAERRGSLGDTVFDDLDGDGIQDPGEPGIENILVRLFDDNNNLITTTRTDANGNYLFPGLTPGTYVIHVVAPNGRIYSPQGAGSDGTVDSDVNPADGKTAGITVASGQDRTDIDAGLVTPNAGIQIDKTVYAGHDNGASCAGGELVEAANGFAITYCFAVQNTGNVALDAITLTDADLGISRSDVTKVSGSEPVAPGASITFFFETTVTDDLVNTASTSGNPIDNAGNDIPGLQDPTDSDTAEVKKLNAAIQIDKTVYPGHDSGASCAGTDLVQGSNGFNVTYCFAVMNTGNTFLDAITVTDADLGISRSDLTLLSGTEPLAPGAMLTFFFETTITGDLVNTASTSGNPTNSSGDDIPGLQDPTDSDTATVDEVDAAIMLGKTVYFGHNGGAFCPGGESVRSANGANVTYCFEVMNTGNVALDAITLDDPDLDIDRSDLTLASGTEPLAPGASLVFFFETTISGDLVNTASASGNPVDGNGDDIPGLQDPSDDDNASVETAAPAIEIEKTVYAGHDNGVSCAGGELVQAANGTAITYCFAVTNTGDTFLDDVTVTDNDLGLSRTDLTLKSGTEPLAPGASLVFFVETTVTGDLVNTASTSGNPTDGNGADLPGLQNPTDSDTAEVDEVQAGIQIDKTVYVGHDSGASCAGSDLATGANGTNITYCFAVMNTGNTFLDAITVTDADLGINRSDLTLASGTEPLAPGASLVFFFETTITGDLVNTASTSGNPTNSNGDDIPNLPNPTDDDTATVDEAAAAIQIDKTVFAGHDSGASCPGGELVQATNGSDVTYCFTVTNTGATFLDDITISDPALSLIRA
ncbi:MAG: SdrD B-like domain-containing protein, partial [Bacteroidota bacterium]